MVNKIFGFLVLLVLLSSTTTAITDFNEQTIKYLPNDNPLLYKWQLGIEKITESFSQKKLIEHAQLRIIESEALGIMGEEELSIKALKEFDKKISKIKKQETFNLIEKEKRRSEQMKLLIIRKQNNEITKEEFKQQVKTMAQENRRIREEESEKRKEMIKLLSNNKIRDNKDFVNDSINDLVNEINKEKGQGSAIDLT